MSNRVLSVFFLVICIYVVEASIILRIRLSNGTMQRLEVDENKDSIISLREKLRNLGAISTDDVYFVLKENKYDLLSDTNTNDNTLTSLGLKNGDIVSITAAPITNNSDSIKKGKDGIRSTSVFDKKNKKITSIADLEKRRQEMIKVTRQKSSNTRSVAMTSVAGRILNRLASTGGCALLIGKTVQIGVSNDGNFGKVTGTTKLLSQQRGNMPFALFVQQKGARSRLHDPGQRKKSDTAKSRIRQISFFSQYIPFKTTINTDKFVETKKIKK